MNSSARASGREFRSSGRCPRGAPESVRLTFVCSLAVVKPDAEKRLPAVASCLTLMPKGWALATLDFTIKMTGIAKGEALRAKGRVLQNGRTNSIGAADVYSVSDGAERLCGTVLATTRNFKIK